MKKIISTSRAPKTGSPTSQAVIANGFIYVSGQLPIDAKSGEIVPGGVKEQTEQVIKNIQYILEEAGYSMDDVIKSTVYLVDIKHSADMNRAYSSLFNEPYPARVAFAVSGLAKGALVEIDVVAYK